MRIVILDGHTANPGDLHWEGLAALGALTIYLRTRPEDVVDRAQGACSLITNKVVIGEAEMAALPELRYIGLLSTGTNVVDLEAARKRGIRVTNVPAYSTPSVAQLTFGLLFELSLGIGRHAQAVSNGAWTKHPDFSMAMQPLTELDGKTFGAIGYGQIGQSCCRIARALGMKTVATRCNPTGQEADLIVCTEQLLVHSDVVSLHCPLTESTASMVDPAFLESMKPGAILLNTARGGLVKEEAVASALRNGHLGGYGADVLQEEPPKQGSPLLDAPNCVLTPHIAWATQQARARLIDVVTKNLHAFARGEPLNVVV